MVEHGRLGGSRGARVVVRRDGVQELREDGALDSLGALFDQSQPEMHVAEQFPLGSREEERAPVELANAAGVVEQRGGDEKIGAQPGMQLRMPHVDADHPHGAPLQEHVGEAPGALANVQAGRALHGNAGVVQRSFELQPAARRVAKLGIVRNLELAAGRQLIARL